jgi:hypothetical protein
MFCGHWFGIKTD